MSGLDRRELLIGLTGGVAGAALSSCTGNQESDEESYNLLFINVDQLRFDAMGCAGSSEVATPNLDRIAREGARFSHAVTPCPVCVPARTSFSTGLSIHTTGYIDNHKWEDPTLNVGEGSFDQHLTSLGYAAEHHGRWHAATQLLDCYRNEVPLNFIEPYKAHLRSKLGEPPDANQGQFVDYLSDWPYDPDPVDSQLRDSRGNPPGHGVLGVAYGVSTLPDGYGYSSYVADEVIGALARLRSESFSITGAILHPHHPQYVSRAFAGSVDPEMMRVPPTLGDERRNTPYHDYPWQVDETEKHHIGLIRARYYEMVQEMDQAVGRILDELDELGLRDRTMVVITADHGEMLGDHGLTQKFVHYDESIRVPLLIRFPPEISGGVVVEHPVNTVDLFATICDYLNLSAPPQEGRSLRPLIEGGSRESPYTFSEFEWKWQKYSLLTSRSWKFVWTAHADQVDMLYNLEEDPRETTNLIGKNSDRVHHLPKAEEVRREMVNWMEEIHHPELDRLAAAEIT